MPKTYFTFQQQPKQKQNKDLLSLYDAITKGAETETNNNQPLSYPQFYTLKLDSTDAIKNTEIVEMQKKILVQRLNELATFAKTFIPATETEANKYYYDFRIPKASGGLRLINAPTEELKALLLNIKNFLQNTMHILPHNAAHAYVPRRSTLSAIQRHQHNESKWFLKIDLKNFFPNCTEDFIHKQLKQIFPLCLMYNTKRNRTAMDIIVKAACYKYGDEYGLPQGTPLSPFLTNILMIPVDYEIHNLCRQWNKQHFVYTRYADDILISSKYEFDFIALQTEIQAILARQTPFDINTEKTRYGSITGRNWNLGLMLNGNNEITIGYRRKRDIKQKLLNFCKTPEEWSVEDIRSFHGELAYFLHIEPEYAEHVIKEYSQKYNSGTDILEQIRASI